MTPQTPSQVLSAAAFLLLLVSAAVQAAFLLRRERRLDPFSHYLLAAAAVLLLAITVERSIRIRFAAVTNTFESLVFFAGVTALVLFLYRLIAKRLLPFVTFGGTVIALALLAIASSPIAPKEVLPPIPALQSYWLVLHVTLSFIGESFFIVGFVSALMYLANRDEEKKQRLDRLTYASIGIGYPIFTAGALIFGAIWAQNAWGNYWSWDPKETWALITWLVYTAFLHTRLVRRLRGRVSAILAIVGFAFTVFTFFGVNYLLSGLHSYG
jgi:ABC-type transport system involved in cytochrome c biogenesis permease subunit